MRRYAQSETVATQACQIWVILVARIMTRTDSSNLGPGRIGYGDLAERMGRGRGEGRILARPLKAIGHLCQAEGLPALNVVVVKKATGEPGGEVVLSRSGSPAEETSLVLAFDWFSVGAPDPSEFRAVF